MSTIERELDLITEDLRKQRQDLERHMSDSQHGSAAELLKSIEQLRERMARTAQQVPGNSKKK